MSGTPWNDAHDHDPAIKSMERIAQENFFVLAVGATGAGIFAAMIAQAALGSLGAAASPNPTVLPAGDFARLVAWLADQPCRPFTAGMIGVVVQGIALLSGVGWLRTEPPAWGGISRRAREAVEILRDAMSFKQGNENRLVLEYMRRAQELTIAGEDPRAAGGYVKVGITVLLVLNLFLYRMFGAAQIHIYRETVLAPMYLFCFCLFQIPLPRDWRSLWRKLRPNRPPPLNQNVPAVGGTPPGELPSSQAA